jgi:3-hydroxyacyl-CoA dehydrogenase/enoyl-CoA hydratase/3-hydroxybutyryl-CoA epimerase
LVEQEGRKGKKTGHGFYDHADDGKTGKTEKTDKTDKTDKTIWPRLREFAAGGTTIEMSVADARDRLLAAQALETVRCLVEGVIVDPSQCDVGALLGWGFAPWTGGPLSWIDRMGVRDCVRRCKELAARYASARLEPPAALEALAARGISVYEASWPGVAGH